ARIIVALSLIGVLAFAADRLRLFERPDGIAAVYAAYRSGARDPALATEDRRRLQLWLSAKLGIPLPRLPELRGYTLVGGEVLDGEAVGAEEGDLAVLAYAPAGDIHPPSDDAEAGTHAPAAVLLLLAPRDEQAWSIVNEELAGDGDLDHVGWNADRFGFLAVSDLPLDRADFALR
ncbi:MAG: hypothetical protein KDE35_14140, partial [Geminicoccaceae bacterium]|nr:hypothetical protein [Geminicoccaceae bacterium]